MQDGLVLADYLILAGFFVIMLGIGLYFSGKMKDLKDFFCGGSQVPWWVSGVSLYMTTFSAFAFVSYSALAYKEGLVCITIWWMTVPCAVLSARFFAARWRRMNITSPVEFVERRFGLFLRQCFSWAGVPLIVMDDALKLFVIGTMVTVSLGIQNHWAMPVAILVCGTIMLSYTLLGGLWAVMITDAVQFVVMAVAVLVLIPLVLIRVGGIMPIFQDAPPRYWSLASEGYSFWWLFPFTIMQFLMYTTKWPIVQRYYAVELDRDAQKVGYTVGFLTFVGVPLLFLPAFAARVFLPGVADANSVYPMVCRQLLPAGLFGMVIAGMFSATMSMLSSDYNAVAAVITNDIYLRLFEPRASQRALVFVGRLATLGVGMAAVVIAMLLSRIENLRDLVQIMAGVFSLLLPPVGIPLFFGFLTRRVSNRGALLGFALGSVSGVAAYALSLFPAESAIVTHMLRLLPHAVLERYPEGTGLAFLNTVPWLTWITALPTLFGVFCLSALLPDGAAKQKEVDEFLAGVRSGDRLRKASPGASRDAGAALSIIGLCTGLIGLLLALAVAVTGHARDGLYSIVVGLVLALLGFVAWRYGKRAALSS
jgi:SSS family solute:Na+ symporter